MLFFQSCRHAVFIRDSGQVPESKKCPTLSRAKEIWGETPRGTMGFGVRGFCSGFARTSEVAEHFP